MKKEPIDDLNDISLINPEMEQKSIGILSGEIIIDSLFSILPLLLFVLTETLNLIFVGHFIKTESYTTHNNLFNFFQIGTVLINLFGMSFAMGILKTMKIEVNNREVYYLNMKILIFLSVIIILLPACLLSYNFLDLIYGKEADEILFYVFKNYLIYAPIYILFFLLFQLNYRVFQIENMRCECLIFFILYICLHTILSFTYIYFFNMGIFGILLSLTITNFSFYIYSNYIISKKLNFLNNFCFCPFGVEWQTIFTTLNNAFVTGIVSHFEYVPFGFFTILSYFINNEALTINIIASNIFLLIHTIGIGYAASLKYYITRSISNYKHSHKGKKKYVRVLGVLVFLTGLFFCIIICTSAKSLVSIYLSRNQAIFSDEVRHGVSDILAFYQFVVFCDYLSQVLDGYVKAIDNKTTFLIIYKLSFLLIFAPLGIVFCFAYNFGLIALWYSIYLYVVINTILNSILVYKFYEMWTG